MGQLPDVLFIDERLDPRRDPVFKKAVDGLQDFTVHPFPPEKQVRRLFSAKQCQLGSPDPQGAEPGNIVGVPHRPPDTEVFKMRCLPVGQRPCQFPHFLIIVPIIRFPIPIHDLQIAGERPEGLRDKPKVRFLQMSIRCDTEPAMAAAVRTAAHVETHSYLPE